ncbi:hypothetical protein ABK040_004108 [Willaertia magna]
MSSKWTTVNKYGIVIEPYSNKQLTHQLELNVGDLVYIRSEKDGWCKGSVFKNRYLLVRKSGNNEVINNVDNNDGNNNIMNSSSSEISSVNQISAFPIPKGFFPSFNIKKIEEKKIIKVDNDDEEGLRTSSQTDSINNTGTPLVGKNKGGNENKLGNITFDNELDEMNENKYGFFDEKDFKLVHCHNIILVIEEWLAFFEGSKERMDLIDRDQFERVYDIICKLVYDLREYKQLYEQYNRTQEMDTNNEDITKLESKLVNIQQTDGKLFEEGCNALLYDIVVRKKGKVLDEMMQFDTSIAENENERGSLNIVDIKTSTSTNMLSQSKETAKSTASTTLSLSSTVTTIIKLYRAYNQTLEKEEQSLEERRKKRANAHSKKEQGGRGFKGILGFHNEGDEKENTQNAVDETKQFYHLPEGNTQLLLNLETCNIEVDFQMEMEIVLYSKKTEQFVSEIYYIPLHTTGDRKFAKLTDENQKGKRCIIKDIDSQDIKDDLFLVIKFSRIGPVILDEEKKKKGNVSSGSLITPSEGDVKRPFGVGIVDINPTVVNSIVSGENVVLNSLVAYTTQKEELFPTLHQTLIKYVNEQTGQIDSNLLPKDIQKLNESTLRYTLSLGMIIGDYAETVFKHHNYRERPVVQMLRFPSTISPSDRRNDIYVTLEGIVANAKEFKNVLVEAQLYQVSQDHSIKNPPIPSSPHELINLHASLDTYDSGNLLSSVPENMRLAFSTTVYYHIKNPKWKETFRVSVEPEMIERSIIVFKIYNCRSRHGNKDLVAFAFWKMTNSSGLLDVTGKNDQEQNTNNEKDKVVELPMYKLTKVFKKGEFNGIFDFHKSPEERETHRTKGFKLLVSFNVVSTRITQNPDMKNLLDWKHQRNVSDVLSAFTFNMGDVMGIAIFIREIFGALFDILGACEAQPGVPEQIFEVTYKAINNILSQKQFWPFMRVIDEYIVSSYFTSKNAYKWLLQFLNRDLAKIKEENAEILNQDPYDKPLPFELEEANKEESQTPTPSEVSTSTTPPPQNGVKKSNNANVAQARGVLSQSIKCIDYWAKLIVISRHNYVETNGQTAEEEKEFERQVSVLMKLIVELLRHEDPAFLGVKANFLKFFSSALFDQLEAVFSDDTKLGRCLVDFMMAMENYSATDKDKNNESKNKTKRYANRLLALGNILKSEVFKRDGCRKVLMPYVIDTIRDGLLENNGGDVDTGINLLHDLLHATQKLMLSANRRQKLVFGSIDKRNDSSLINSLTRFTNESNYTFQKKRRTFSSLTNSSYPQEGDNYSDGLIHTIYDIFQLFHPIKERYEAFTQTSQGIKLDIEEKKKQLAETQNETEKNKQEIAKVRVSAKNNKDEIKKAIKEKEESLSQIELKRKDLMCSIISFVRMFSGSSVLLLTHLIQDEKLSTGLCQTSIKNIFYLHELIISKNNNIPRAWIGFKVFEYNTLFRSLISISNVMIQHFTSKATSLTTVVQTQTEMLNGETNNEASSSVEPVITNVEQDEGAPSEFKELWDLLFKHCFNFIYYLDIENMKAYERVKILSKHEDYRFWLLKHLYENIYRHPNMKMDIKLIFVPKLIHQIMPLFNIHNKVLHSPALNLYYALLETEYENHKKLEQCEAVTQSRVVRSKIGKLFKECFTDRLRGLFSANVEKEAPESVAALMSKEGLSLLKRLDNLITQVEEIQIYEDKDEHRFCEACIDVMRSFKSNSNFDLYYQYVDKLCALHERLGNFTEAALVLYKHAKRLNWDDERKLPYHSDEYPEQSEAERKVKIYEKMIDLFDKGKDWERAIELSTQLRNYYLTNFKYAKIQNQLKKEGDFYNLIMTKRRFFATYYYVNFMGKGFLKIGLQGPYIYKSVEGENFIEFLDKMKDKYQAQLFQKLPNDPEQYRTQEGKFFIAYKVDPSSEAEKENLFQHRDKRVSPKISCYKKLHNINYFKTESRYRESKEKTLNEYKDMHRDIIFYIAPKKFPTICRRQRVLTGESLKVFDQKILSGEKFKNKHYSSLIELQNMPYVANDRTLHLCPLENAIKDIEDKVNELEDLVINHHLDQQPDTNALSMSLNGTIDAAVNGGMNKYIEAFLTEQYMQLHPEHKHLLARFKLALQNQLSILDEGLKQRRLFVEGKALALNDYLEGRLLEMKKKLEEVFASNKQM